MLTAAHVVLGLSMLASGSEDPALSALEAARGFRALSGADATSVWRGYRQMSFPKQGWTAADGELRHAAGGGGGDLVTIEQYGDFELLFDFRLAPKANSGVMWRVAETHDTTWQTGPEFQVLEDATYGAQPTDMHACGAMYGLVPPAEGKTMRPAGEWNSGRIRVRNGVAQHWLNGFKVAEARIADERGQPAREWLDLIAASKFKDYEGFGVQSRGHLAIQDHGDEVAYRNVRARHLGAHAPGERHLFNGRDLTGWVAVVPEAAARGITPESVWRVEDGVLICSGNPAGYIRTERAYTNFILKLEWRFNPVTKQAGNSGVLVRLIGEDKVWPKSVEAQLQSGNAGDFWNIDQFGMSVDPTRTSGRNTRKTHGAERPVGEWNEYEIVVHKGDVVLFVNGEELNRAWDVDEVPGTIGLQSEGAEIHFRNIRITPLD